jgi:nucleoid DNA-binding protein
MESVNIDVVAKSVGMNPVTCPHCARKFSMDDMINLLFQKIVELAAAGKRIHIRSFGLFYMNTLKGHSIDTIATDGPVKFQDVNLLRFRQSKSTKEALNVDRAQRKEAAKKGKASK